MLPSGISSIVFPLNSTSFWRPVLIHLCHSHLLRERRQVLEVRTEQLRCTREETKAFLHQAMGTKFPMTPSKR